MGNSSSRYAISVSILAGRGLFKRAGEVFSQVIHKLPWPVDYRSGIVLFFVTLTKTLRFLIANGLMRCKPDFYHPEAY